MDFFHEYLCAPIAGRSTFVTTECVSVYTDDGREAHQDDVGMRSVCPTRMV